MVIFKTKRWIKNSSIENENIKSMSLIKSGGIKLKILFESKNIIYYI